MLLEPLPRLLKLTDSMYESATLTTFRQCKKMDPVTFCIDLLSDE